jgi:hypothetical protein
VSGELRIDRAWQPKALAWRHDDAPLALARVFGEVAADLWLAGTVTLTTDHVVATMSVDAEAAPDQDRDDQAAGDDSGRQEVA